MADELSDEQKGSINILTGYEHGIAREI